MSVFKDETPADTAFRKEQEALQSLLDSALSSQLPEGTDYYYFKTFPEFSERLDAAKRKLVETLRMIPGADVAAHLDLEDPEEALMWLLEVLDARLEKVDRAVDQGNAIVEERKKVTFQAKQSPGAAPKDAGQIAGTRFERETKQRDYMYAQMNASGAIRPQKEFEDLVDNSNRTFAGVLGHWRQWAQEEGAAPPRLQPYLRMLRLEPEEGEPPHPLHDVIEGMSYQEAQLVAREPQMYRGLDRAPITYVDTPAQLEQMVRDLDDAAEVAVDLEHHGFRSFLGMTCLMQVSDRHQDWLVDVLKLRREVGPMLAPIFADPKVVKVLHGSDRDIHWLQRDFGIYVANLFDTGQAARILHPRYGLAYLLQRYCNVEADKKYQLADWRARPLSAEMQLYARMDTHYLLYIYDCLKMELLSAREDVPMGLVLKDSEGRQLNALDTVLEHSRQLSLSRYDKPLFREDTYKEAIRQLRGPQRLTRRQEAVFAALFEWRDTTARKMDESIDYVIPKTQLLKLSISQPTTAKAFNAALSGSKIPSLAPKLMEDIMGVIVDAAKDLPEDSEDTPTRPTASGSIAPEAPTLGSPSPSVSFWQGPQLHAGLKPVDPIESSPVSAVIAGATATSSKDESRSAAQPSPVPAVEPLAEESALLTLPSEATDRSDKQPPAEGVHLSVASGDATDAIPKPDCIKQLTETEGTVVAEAPNSGRPVTALSWKPQPMKKKASAFAKAFSRSASKPSQVPAGTDAAMAIRANFAVPFPLLESTAEPISNAATPPTSAHEVEAPEAATREQIRNVADGLREDGGQEAMEDIVANIPTPSSIARQAEPLEEYLPLPLSEVKKIERRGQLRENDGVKKRKVDQDARIKAALQEAGLEASASSSDDDGSAAASSSDDGGNTADTTGRTPDGRILGPVVSPKSRKRSKPNSDVGEAFKPIRGGESGSGQQLEETEPAGGPVQETLLERFDYAAARAAKPGLDLHLGADGIRGRGGAHGRRGGRGSRGGRQSSGRSTAQVDPFNMYQLDESKFMKGGKRSSVFPRSGNKSRAFG